MKCRIVTARTIFCIIIFGNQHTFGNVSGCDAGVITGGNNKFVRYGYIAGDQVLLPGAITIGDGGGVTVPFLNKIDRSEMPHNRESVVVVVIISNCVNIFASRLLTTTTSATHTAAVSRSVNRTVVLIFPLPP